MKQEKWIWMIVIAMILSIIVCSVLKADPVSKKITWTSVGDDGHTGQASWYAIAVSTDSTELVNNFDSCVTCIMQGTRDDIFPQIAGMQEIYQIDSLQPNTTYYCAIKTADEVPNWSGMSNITVLTTPDNDSPAIVNDLMEWIE